MWPGKRNTPRWLILLIDMLMVASAVILAYLVRFNFSIPAGELQQLPRVLAYIMAVRLLGFLIARTYAGIIRYTSTQDAIRIALVMTGGSVVFVLTNLYTYYGGGRYFFIPFSIIIIEFIAGIFGMTMFRVLVKIAYMELMNPRKERSGVIIFGAGEAGLITKRTLDRDAGTRLRVVAFVDDDPRKTGNKLENIRIVHGDKLDSLLAEGKAETLIIAIQHIPPSRRAEVVDLCLKYDIRVLNVPPVIRWINGELSFRQLKEINIVDLLERDVIEMDRARIMKDLSGKSILITGASGSIGSELARQIATFDPLSLILLDQAESPLFEIENELRGSAPGLRFSTVVADITNASRLSYLFQRFRPEIIFHSAAYKHVPMMEDNPLEALHTNVLGTRNLADLAMEHGVAKFIMVSTDKAVNPTSVMGASKRMAEMYVQAMNGRAMTRFITTRFGNVLGSNGSVIPVFKKQIEKGGPLTLTHPDVTRFFMTIPEACQLVLEAGTMGQGGEIFIFDMGESVRIQDLARKMIKLSGLELGKDIQLVYTGLRPGEKLYEELLNTEENTLPTYHPKIMIARVREADPVRMTSAMEELLKVVEAQDRKRAIAMVHTLVPEFVSSNPEFGRPD